MLIEYVHMAERKRRIPTGNRALAPLDSSLNDIEAFVGAGGAENLSERDGLFADSTTDVEDVVVRLEIAIFYERVQKLIVAETASADEPKSARWNERIPPACQEVKGIEREKCDAANGQPSFEFGECAFRQNCELQNYSPKLV